MQPKTRLPAKLLIGLLLVVCLLTPWLAIHAADQGKPDRQPLAVAAGEDQQHTSATFKDSADFLRLTRREFAAELWQSVIVQNDCWLASSFDSDVHSSHQVLCEFARREVAGVLLS